MPVNNTIQLRKGTSATWTSADPVLANGEPGFDTTNNILKIGNGISTWSQLSSIVFAGISGSPSSSTFLRGDGTWATPTGGSSSASDLTSGTLDNARLTTSAQSAINLYLWSNFR